MGEEFCGEGICVGEHDSSVREDRYEGPGERACEHGDVDEALGRCGGGDVERFEITEVDGEQELCEPEAGADPEHDEGGLQEVVQYEAAADGRGGCYKVDVVGEKVQGIAEL